ncbi:MAG TPA: YfhO family protein [Candidatus Goldiibacteriota bacterium]|nr:YfhO family protein [Candidatus Goldiibacteriota bacterium]HRQ44745.1 YfhO family protein [Candidatus Goldiibacteriota bacterium]
MSWQGINQKKLIYPLLYLVTAFFVFFEQNTSSKIAAWMDFLYYFMPFRELVSASVRAGEVPLWNPYVFCGNPLMANMQSAVFYPLNIFYYLMPFDIAFKVQTTLIFFIAAVFMFKTVKLYGVSDKGAFLSGFLFAFSFYLTVRTVELADLNTIVWAPAAVYFSLRWLKKGMLHDMFFSSAALSLSFLGGHPQVFMYVYIIFVVLFIYEAKKTVNVKPGPLAGFFLINIMLAGLIMVQMLPTAEFVLNSKRSGHGFSMLNVRQYYVGFEQMVSFFFPFLSEKFGPESSFLNWMGRIDIGVAALLMFLLAAFKMEDRKFKNFLMVVFTLSLFMVFLGRMPFFEKLYELIPVMKTMRYGSKINVILYFILCLMAGIGFDIAAGGDRKKTGKFSFFLNIFAVLLLLVYASASVFREPVLKAYKEIFMPSADFQGIYDLVEDYNYLMRQFLVYTAYTCAMAALIFVNREGFVLKRYAPVLMLFTACGAVFSYYTAGYDFFQKFEDIKTRTGTINFLLNDSDISSGSLRLLAPSEIGKLNNNTQTMDQDKLLYISKDKLSPNVTMPFNILNADGFDSLEIASFVRFRSLLSTADKPWELPVFSLFSVKYIAAVPKISGRYISESFRGETGIYENYNRVSRVNYVPLSDRIHYTNDNNEIYEGLKRTDFNPLKYLYLEEKARENTSGIPDIKIKDLDVRFKPAGLNRLDIKIMAPGPGYAVVNDSYYPGWEAYVNGVKKPLYKANSTFRAVKVEAGENNIQLIFKPVIVTVSFVISTAAAIILLLYGVFYFIIRRRVA